MDGEALIISLKKKNEDLILENKAIKENMESIRDDLAAADRKHQDVLVLHKQEMLLEIEDEEIKKENRKNGKEKKKESDSESNVFVQEIVKRIFARNEQGQLELSSTQGMLCQMTNVIQSTKELRK